VAKWHPKSEAASSEGSSAGKNARGTGQRTLRGIGCRVFVAIMDGE
jgi:hypothetical protein